MKIEYPPVTYYPVIYLPILQVISKHNIPGDLSFIFSHFRDFGLWSKTLPISNRGDGYPYVKWIKHYICNRRKSRAVLLLDMNKKLVHRV